MFIRIMFAFSVTLTTVIMNCSIFLMQQHNHKEYNKFLEILRKLKCNYLICCCCKSVIGDGVTLEMAENAAAGSQKENESTQKTTSSELEKDAKKTQAVVAKMEKRLNKHPWTKKFA